MEARNWQEWYKHQDDYNKYGIDMKPRAPKKERVAESKATAKDRLRLIMVIVMVGIIALGCVCAKAYSEEINYNINRLTESNRALQGEVEMLNIQLESASNIAEIQDKAINELGMIYPEGEQLVTLEYAHGTGVADCISGASVIIDNLASL